MEGRRSTAWTIMRRVGEYSFRRIVTIILMEGEEIFLLAELHPHYTGNSNYLPVTHWECPDQRANVNCSGGQIIYHRV